MRAVIWTDNFGFYHRALIKDGDPDDMARMGIPQDPPDLNQIEWEMFKRDIHNILAEQGAICYDDLVRSSSAGMAGAIAIFKRYLTDLYRTEAIKKKQTQS